MAVDLEPKLLEILACPGEGGALRAGSAGDAQADYLTCTECGRGFPVRDGIPVLLLEEAVGGSDAGGSGRAGSPGER